MRFRRRSFRRGPREPFRWFRNEQTIYQTSFVPPSTSVATLFSPATVVSTEDETLTVRRVILDQWPVLNVPTGVIASGSAAGVPVFLDWAIVVRDVDNTNIPLDMKDLFGRGWDIIQEGSIPYYFFGVPATTGPWLNAMTTQNWIDTKINRVLQTQQRLELVTHVRFPPQCDSSTFFAPGEDPGCFIHWYNFSVLWQRHMRRR